MKVSELEKMTRDYSEGLALLKTDLKAHKGKRFDAHFQGELAAWQAEHDRLAALVAQVESDTRRLQADLEKSHAAAVIAREKMGIDDPEAITSPSNAAPSRADVEKVITGLAYARPAAEQEAIRKAYEAKND